MTNASERLFFSGDSLEQAVMAAARHYECDPDELLYERVEKRHGFLRTRRRVVIRIDPQNYRRPMGAPSESDLPSPEAQLEAVDRGSGAPPSPSTEAKSSSRRRSAERSWEDDEEETVGLVQHTPLRERLPAAEGEAAAATREALDRLIALVNLELEAAVLQGEERLEVEIYGPDEESLQEGEAVLLHAFQHLIPRMTQARLGRILPCRVDSGGYQEMREERLRDLAQRVATEVRTDRRPKTLRPMSPADRRIVHVTLAEVPGVETESHGDGYFKRVTVRTLDGA